MKLRAILLGVAAVALCAAGADDGAAQGPSAVVNHKPYGWADVAQWPDLGTGIWGGVGGAPGPPPKGGFNLPLKPDFVAKQAARRAKQARSYGDCEPMGAIADSGSKFYIGKEVILIGGLSDWYNPWRRVYMNRTSHDDPEPSYFGDSIGHWEGGTLVIDTVALRSRDQIMQGEPIGSDNTHIVERIKLIDKNTLQWDKIVYNADVFSKPWHTVKTIKRDTDDGDFAESYCWQDRDQGGSPDLTPPVAP